MAVNRRQTATPPPAAAVNWLEDAFYSGGFNLPPGEYAMNFTTVMHQPLRADGSPFRDANLAVHVDCYPLNGAAALEYHFGLGRKAHLSFLPTEDGKSLAPVPGSTGNLNNLTAWAVFRKSLRDCGLPDGVATSDLTALDGIWVRTDNVDEPEERKNLGANNRVGEAAGDAPEKPRGPQKVAVCVEILENGKPWEGTGGFENLQPSTPIAAPAPVRAGPRAVAKPAVAPKVAPRPPAKAPLAPPPPQEAAEIDDQAIYDAALAAIGAHLEKPNNAGGCTKLSLRNQVFNTVGKDNGDDIAQAVMSTYMGTDAALNTILGELGYVAKGPMVSPVA